MVLIIEDGRGWPSGINMRHIWFIQGSLQRRARQSLRDLGIEAPPARALWAVRPARSREAPAYSGESVSRVCYRESVVTTGNERC